MEAFTNKVKFKYFSKTGKFRSLLMLKGPVINKANIIYKGTCPCSEFYVGDMKQNSKVRWREYCFTKKTSEVDEHFLLNPGQTVNRGVLTNAPKQIYKWELLEACYIRTLQPTLNNQLDTKCTVLFRNGITRFLTSN